MNNTQQRIGWSFINGALEAQMIHVIFDHVRGTDLISNWYLLAALLIVAYCNVSLIADLYLYRRS